MLGSTVGSLPLGKCPIEDRYFRVWGDLGFCAYRFTRTMERSVLGKGIPEKLHVDFWQLGQAARKPLKPQPRVRAEPKTQNPKPLTLLSLLGREI